MARKNVGNLEGSSEGIGGVDGINIEPGTGNFIRKASNKVVGQQVQRGIVMTQEVPGPPGPPGKDGADGADGAGVAPAGTEHQFLVKNSGLDFDTSWTSGLVASSIDLSGSFVQTPIVVNGNSIDVSLGNYFTATVSADTTYTFDNAISGKTNSFILKVEHTGGNITWPVSVTWPNNEAPSVQVDRTHMFVFITDDAGTTWRGVLSLVNYIN